MHFKGFQRIQRITAIDWIVEKSTTNDQRMQG